MYAARYLLGVCESRWTGDWKLPVWEGLREPPPPQQWPRGTVNDSPQSLKGQRRDKTKPRKGFSELSLNYNVQRHNLFRKETRRTLPFLKGFKIDVIGTFFFCNAAVYVF